VLIQHSNPEYVCLKILTKDLDKSTCERPVVAESGPSFW